MKSVFFHLAAISVNLFVSNVFILFISLSLYIHQCSVHTKRNTLKTPLSLDLRYWNFEAPQKKKKKKWCSILQQHETLKSLSPSVSYYLSSYLSLYQIVSPSYISPLTFYFFLYIQDLIFVSSPTLRRFTSFYLVYIFIYC